LDGEFPDRDGVFYGKESERNNYRLSRINS